MSREMQKEWISTGNTTLGIEFGSTRIKAVLIGADHEPLASGSHDWENRYDGTIWTYRLEDIWDGLRTSYQRMAAEVEETYGIALETVGVIGFSAMMHGYMPFDHTGKLLVPFRTWRNNITGEASEELTKRFLFQIPQRWSIAHLRQAILNREEHTAQIAYMTTLAGYIHWMLTGEKVIGVGEASGMFPIDGTTKNYNERMLAQFDELVEAENLPWKLKDILPKVLLAGDDAGVLSEKGALLLDPSGRLKPGIPFCPPEGDAGTGMVATNSVAVRTGNVSAGTSVFAMIVLEKDLEKLHPEIDMVTTPAGNPVAMVHSNNCTSDLNAWVSLFQEFTECVGSRMDMGELFPALYRRALEGDADCGGLLSYCYFSGEHITGFEEGRPLFVRTPESRFTLANFMRTHLYTAVGALKIGMDILIREEKVRVDEILGHGGLFKTEGVGQKIMADAMNIPVSVMETAGEGGAWGIALLAAYRKNKTEHESLDAYLNRCVFAGKAGSRMEPDAKGVEGFESFMKRYVRGLRIEQAAVGYLDA